MAQSITPTAALKGGGGLLEAYGSYASGVAARKRGELQQTLNEESATQVVAAAQRDALEERRRAEILASRALAVAAASGGGASDPSVANLIADIESEGAYRAAVAMYQGESKARQLKYEGALAKWEGKMQQRAANIGALSSLAKGAVGFL